MKMKKEKSIHRALIRKWLRIDGMNKYRINLGRMIQNDLVSIINLLDNFLIVNRKKISKNQQSMAMRVALEYMWII